MNIGVVKSGQNEVRRYERVVNIVYLNGEILQSIANVCFILFYFKKSIIKNI